MAKVFIDGEAGTTGLGIAQRLRGVPEIELISLDDASRKDITARQQAMAAADVTVLCLPDQAAREAVAMAPAGARILDASSAHRVAPGWVYGFPELRPGQAGEIAAARLVSNPGCYPTGAIALLRPLVEAGLVEAGQDITINAISGYSGDGKAMIAAHEASGGPAFELYGLGLAHKHIPEIMALTGLTRRPIFVPSVGHFRQGMLVSIPLFLDRLTGQPTGERIAALLQEQYREMPRIRVQLGDAAMRPQPQDLNGTNNLELFVFANAVHRHAVLMARLDNLGKGASGAAVQNLALMLNIKGD